MVVADRPNGVAGIRSVCVITAFLMDARALKRGPCGKGKPYAPAAPPPHASTTPHTKTSAGDMGRRA
jgi:hypothetical protein